MMNPLYLGMEDVVREVAPGVEIYEGQPVTLDLNSKCVPATDASAVYGVAKFDRNQYRDLSGFMFHPDARGGLKMTIVKKNIVQLIPNIYDVSPGTQLKHYVWDNTKVYPIMGKVKVDGTGKITPATGSEVSVFAIVTAVGTDFLELDLLV